MSELRERVFDLMNGIAYTGISEKVLEEQVDAILALWNQERATMRKALESIANHPHNAYYDLGEQGMYSIGVTDGHRCAAKIARAALAGKEEPTNDPISQANAVRRAFQFTVDGPLPTLPKGTEGGKV